MIDSTYLTSIEACIKKAITLKVKREAVSEQYLTESPCTCTPDHATLQRWLKLVQLWSISGVATGLMTEDEFRLILDEISLTLDCM